MKKGTKITSIAVGAGLAGITAFSGMTESTRDKLEDILESSRDSHGMVIDRIQHDPTLSEAQRTLHIKIQGKYNILIGNIENNKRFHGFWGMWGSKLPLFGDTEKRLKEIHGKIQTATSEKELDEINVVLKDLLDEFHVIMLKDEEEIQKELSEGVAHISAHDRETIQSYMRECLGIIKNELTVGDTSADYTLTNGSELEGMLEEFINETDSERSNEILQKLVNHYRDMYGDSESELALHHMAEIAERLIAGDSPEEIVGKVFGITFGVGAVAIVGVTAMALLLFAVFVMIKMTSLFASVKGGIKKMQEIEKWLQRYAPPAMALGVATWEFIKKVWWKCVERLKNGGKFPIRKDEKGRIIIDLDGDGIDDREEK